MESVANACLVSMLRWPLTPEADSRFLETSVDPGAGAHSSPFLSPQQQLLGSVRGAEGLR